VNELQAALPEFKGHLRDLVDGLLEALFAKNLLIKGDVASLGVLRRKVGAKDAGELAAAFQEDVGGVDNAVASFGDSSASVEQSLCPIEELALLTAMLGDEGGNTLRCLLHELPELEISDCSSARARVLRIEREARELDQLALERLKDNDQKPDLAEDAVGVWWLRWFRTRCAYGRSLSGTVGRAGILLTDDDGLSTPIYKDYLVKRS